MKNKLIVVAYHMGRVGSSALMGLLKNMDVYVGDENKMPKAGAMNPKGFFELDSQREFLNRVYKGVYPDVVPPPSYKYVEEIARNYSIEYRNLLDNEFMTRPLAAVKSQRMLTLPLLDKLSDLYDIKIVVIERDTKRQAQSIRRVWDKCDKDIEWDVEKITNWILKWKCLSKEILSHCDLDRIHMNFESIVEEPIEQMKMLSGFVGIDSIKEDKIATWIDKSLVDRNTLI